MGMEERKSWYLTKPGAISRYLFSVFEQWGYFAWWNDSADSESAYLKVNLGTSLDVRMFHIRISDHAIPPERQRVIFDVDLYCSYEREGATSYIKLLTNLSNELRKPLPAHFQYIKPGTASYKNYRIELQRRGALGKRKPHSFAGAKLYV
jgi:hypothetical protein